MELFVNDDIKQSVKLCINHHACLNGKKQNICNVISTLNTYELYVYGKGNSHCNYKHPLNERFLCTCPMRMEIYNKYGI
jgi:hypothetical protein